MLAVWIALAQAQPQAPAQNPNEPAWFQFVPMLAIALMGYLLLVLPMRRERKQRLEMMSSLEKGDRVIIQNAIVGIVAQVAKPEEKTGETELLVKIDENANVKMRVLASAVTRVIKAGKDSKDGA